MNAVHIATSQVFSAAIIGICLILNTITTAKSTNTNTVGYTPEINLQNTFEKLRSSIDTKGAENGNFKSYLSAVGPTEQQPNHDFFQLDEDINRQISGLNFNFDQNAYDQMNFPPTQPSVQPKFLLNYEPLRPTRSSGGGGGNSEADGADDDGDDARFIQNEPFELDYDVNFEARNGWRPVQSRPSSDDVSENQFKRPLPKKVRGYGTNHVPLTSDSFQTPYQHNSPYRQQQPQRFAEERYSHRPVQNKRPLRIYDDDNKPLRLHENKKRPLRINGKNGRSPYHMGSKKSEDFLDEEIEEDDPRPLQSRRSPATKKRQVCQKVKKSMSPNDIEDHDIIGRKMTCMRCKDLSSGGTFEKCSYNSDPTSNENLKDSEVIPKLKSNRPRTNRYKRRIVDRRRNKPQSGEEIEDYEYDNSNPQASEEDLEYVQKPESTVEYDNEDPENLETSENLSEEYIIPPLPLESSTCHKVMKKGNVCNVCQDSLSNRQYEQCEYENDPSKNAYEFSTRDVYGKPRYKRQLDSDRTYDDYFKKLFPELGTNRKNSLATKFSSKDGDFGFLDNGQIGFKKRKSSLLGDDDLSINFDSAEESPVNKMLGEFRNKDRSNCKKSIKDKMTCYKCKDDKEVETEECMYITDTQPKERKQTYHEKKNFNITPAESSKSTSDLDKSNPNVKQQQPASTSLSHVYAPLFGGSKYEPSAQYSYNLPHRNRRNYRLQKKPVTEVPEESVEEVDDQSEAQSAEDYDEVEDPSTKQVSRHDMPDVDPFGPEGAYSEETIPMYDTMLQTWLPKYMVLKSSEEAMVDEELGLD
ncbi:Hypothetical protein CINCED_3A025908 [Cinara cedri]|uniref:Uncharacterized protein n=1 Tax=Cinara cedri TaxID=506608 RepID=A0A5E4NFK8_9HEMI|nr:Hypothetical protein CINCED_3A025908 [Cinara cedri]